MTVPLLRKCQIATCVPLCPAVSRCVPCGRALSPLRDSQQHEPGPRRTRFEKQRRKAAIQRSQTSLLMDSESEQVADCDLLVPVHSPPTVSQRFLDSNIFRPEPVCPMLKATM